MRQGKGFSITSLWFASVQLLQERLAKRQALSEQYTSMGQREQKGNVFRVQDLKESAKSLCKSEDLNEVQMQR